MKDIESFEAWWGEQQIFAGAEQFKDVAKKAWLSRAAVEADRAQRVPDGFALVPIEPTPEMLNCGLVPTNEGEKFAADLAAGYRKTIWAAMLASTPAPAQREESCATCGLGPPPDGFGCAWCGRQAASTPAPAQQECGIATDDELFVAWKAGEQLQYFVVHGYDSEWSDYNGASAPTTQGGRLAWRKARKAAQPQDPPQQEVLCDCVTEIRADGEKETRCGSKQMWRAVQGGFAFASKPPQQERKPDPHLLKFYGVTTADELIAAQAAHIEKLQAKLSPLPVCAPQRVREG